MKKITRGMDDFQSVLNEIEDDRLTPEEKHLKYHLNMTRKSNSGDGYVISDEIPYSNKEFDFEKAEKVHKILEENLKVVSCNNCKYLEAPMRGGVACDECNGYSNWQPSKFLLNFMTNHIVEIFNNQANE